MQRADAEFLTLIFHTESNGDLPNRLAGENTSAIVRSMDPKEVINTNENMTALTFLSLSNTDSYKLYVKVYTVYGLNAVTSTVTRPRTCWKSSKRSNKTFRNKLYPVE
jgi:hypothetical protein